MIYLFSNNGLKLLESLCFTKTLFTFDFDGTLSKIVLDPEKAKVTDSTLNLLQKLNQYAPLAIISGRSLDDLKSRCGLSSAYLVGNHGLEGISAAEKKREIFRESCVAWRLYLERHWKKLEDLGGVEIEDKTYSLAIHYRKSRQKKMAKISILELASQLSIPPRIIMGKCVVNLVPAGGPHKGVAFLELMIKSETRSAFYIGDDDTDEDIFTLPDPGLFTVRVGKKNNSQAKFFIRDQNQVNLLLKTLISFFATGKIREAAA